MYCTLLQGKWLLSLLYYDEVKAIIYILPMIAFSMIEYWKIKLVWRVLWSLDFKELLLVLVILVYLIISIIYHLLMTTYLLFKRIVSGLCIKEIQNTFWYSIINYYNTITCLLLESKLVNLSQVK